MLKAFLRLRWRLVAVLFVAGVLLRLPMLSVQHQEGDEVIYMSLVAQLDHGRGYSLQHHPLIERGIIDRYQYDRPLFFHPPGGIALFWLAYKVFGEGGFAVVQFGCFAIFFWSMLLLAQGLRITKSNGGLFVVAFLSAFNPIVVRVTTKYWLDAPLLAFATLACALFVWVWTRATAGTTPFAQDATAAGARSKPRRSKASVRASRSGNHREVRSVSHGRVLGASIVAGIVLGYASLIKLTAFEIVPGVLLVGMAIARPLAWKPFLTHALCLVVPALLVQMPWEIWQWLVVGSPFPQWAGKPSETLIQSNNYIAFLTVVRSPWFYLTTTPLVLTTIVPATLLHLLGYLRGKVEPVSSGDASIPDARRLATACVLWITVVVACNIALGFAGYSKLLRYVILLTPASILLPALVLPCWAHEKLHEKLGEKSSEQSRLLAVVGRLKTAAAVCIVVGILLEVTTGIRTAVQVGRSLIVPLTGL
jgi:4-amino-4-deoxy-L-arabinose transferase-like glycosyltransferase